MADSPVVIIGGGLAGLTTLAKITQAGQECVLLEAENRVGGLCRTEKAGGFSFDYTGHLLHLKEGQVRDFVMELVGDTLVNHARRASVFTNGKFVPYPIQANFGALDKDTAEKCIDSFRALRVEGSACGPDFISWSRSTFGEGLSDIFMLPYNRKLFVHPLEELEPSWTSWSVPRPSAEDMERAARGEDTGSFGYNVNFLYPSEGGIEILARRLAKISGDAVQLNSKVTGVNLEKKTLTTSDGEVISYSRLISTMPLPGLLGIIKEKSGYFGGAAGSLRYSSVLSLCIGLDGPVSRDEHWIYFPEERFPFYRVGFPSNFSGGVAPEGCASMYVEVAHEPCSTPDGKKLLAVTMEHLRGTGIIREGVGVANELILPIQCAYVFYDRFRLENLPGILEELKIAGVHSVGRYGAWEYSSMEDAISWGMRAAAEALS